MGDAGASRTPPASARTKGGRAVGRTKESKRPTTTRIGLDAHTVKVLRQYVGIRQDGPLFLSKTGKAVDYSYWLPTVWRDVTNALGLDIKPHITRHQHVSELIMAGVPDFIIIRRTRHKNTKILHDTYGHLYESAQDSALDQLAAWQEGQKKAAEALGRKLGPRDAKA